MLNTLKFYNKLKEAGMPEAQAEAYVAGLAAIVNGDINPPEYEKKLKEAGIPKKQAEVMVRILQELIKTGLA